MSQHPLTTGGYSIFRDTMADMTYPEVERAARDGATLLWGLGVIEQHGPHLPLGTDVYVPSARLRRVRQLLGERGIRALIVPPFYWGINHVTGGFPGTFQVRPQTMVELMVDVIASVKKDGFRSLFCLSGHGDALHNRTLDEGVRRGRLETGVDVCVVLSRSLAERLGCDLAAPHLVVTEAERPTGTFVDVHAGDWETSVVWGCYPDLVRQDVVPTLRSTDFGPADLAEWRRGGEATMRKTPHGYLGDPASADPERGRASLEREAGQIASAIAARLAR
jgi:creatinine amidohydrolase